MRNVLLLGSFLVSISLMACGGSGGSGDSTGPVLESATPNPIVRTQLFGDGGNLYKPVSDDHGSGGGNLVVLFDRQFTEAFDSCEIPLADGTVAPLICIDNQPWTQKPYSCFSNGERQTWRANFRCGAVGEIKVTCRSLTQEVIFTVPEAVRGHVCTRFG